MTRVWAFGAETFRSLRIPNFRKFFAGQAISQTGTWMQLIAINILVYRLTGSGIALGLVTAAQFGPMLVLGAWAGLVADRSDRHRLLITLNVAGAVVAGTFALLVLAGWQQLWSVYALTTASGIVIALENPVRRSFVTDLVEDTEIPNAVGLNSMLMTSARVVGPAVAAGLISGPGIGWAFAVNALSFLPQLWLFARMDRSRLRDLVPVTKAKGQLREGFRYVWSTPELRLPLVLVAAVGTLAFNFPVVLPIFATRDLGGDDNLYALLFSVMGVGSVIGSLTLARRAGTDARFLAFGAIALGVSMIGLAAAPTVPAALLLSIPVGATSVLVIAGSNAVIQLTAAPAMRGRALALLAVVFLGSTPIGGPVAGWLSEVVSARAALLMGAAASLAAGAWVLGVLGRGRLSSAPHEAATGPAVPVEEAPVTIPAGRSPMPPATCRAPAWGPLRGRAGARGPARR